MTNVVKRLLYDEQKDWFNKNNWSIFQSALVSKGATTYRYPSTTNSGIEEKLSFLGNENQINHFNANPADLAKNIMVSRNGPQWEKVGQDIDGEAAFDESGFSVSLSSDGSLVAIGAPFNSGNGSYSGHVRVYQYGQNEDGNYGWHQLGETIQGEAVEDYSGFSVSLSADGFTVAIGADMSIQNRPGHVRVYEYRDYTANDEGKFHYESRIVDDEQNKPLIITENFNTLPVANKSYWIQKGHDIDGVNIKEQSGESVSLSADGSVVAIGALQTLIPENNGYVRIFKYSIIDGNTDYSWTQLGSDIVGDDSNVQFGDSISLSADGTVVAIGDALTDERVENSGRVRVYKYHLNDEENSPDWHPLGLNIEGEAEIDYSGRAVSLSADGSVLAIGARYNNPVPEQSQVKAGHVRVYKYRKYRDEDNNDNDGTSKFNYTSTVVNDEQTKPIMVLESSDETNPQVGNFYWMQLGLDIDGDSDDHDDPPRAPIFSPDYGLSLSNDGFIVAIGNPFTDINGVNSGHVRIYQHDPSKTQEDGNGPIGWNRVGQDIYGESAQDLSGTSVSLSGDGSVVAIGAISNDGNGSNSGQVRVYQIAKRNPWVQQGLDIDGEAASDLSGYLVSLSADGSTLAIGAPFNDGNGTESGHVRVYKYDGSLWQKRGEDIDGEGEGDAGMTVSLSADGSIVAIGAGYNDGDNGNVENSGHVRVYEYNDHSSLWEQVGGDIDGESAHDQSGHSVSLSADGSIVAIGAPVNGGDNGLYSGHVRVYRRNPGWNRMGGDIDGESAFDFSGESVALSADGSIVAIGAIINNRGEYSGHVRVYEYNDHNSLWEQVGGDIDGEAAGDQSGYSVSLSADGSIVAIGAKNNNGSGEYSGHVRVYEYNDHSSLWEQIGGDIDGEAAGDQSGYSVSLSADGSIVAIGAPINGGDNGLDSGHVRVYKYNGSSWQKLGRDIDGEAAGDQSGNSISLSADGSVLAIGAFRNNGNGELSGHVRVYKFTGCYLLYN
jgi:hypothetical protein